jgi:arabinogalactan oligomer/maltooligosaccharide transport system substrate-binding protein
MKKNTLAALILTTLAAGQLVSLQAHAAGQLNVWEDIKKSDGIKAAVSDFEKQYNVKVNVQEMPYAQQLEKLRLDGPAGIGPDVLVIPNDQLGGAVVQGLLSPLTLDQAKQEAFTPASINAFRMDNVLYGVPKAVETLVLIYNKDLIDKPLDSLQAWFDYSKSSARRTNTACWPSLTRSITAGGDWPDGRLYLWQKRQGGFNPQDVGLNKPGAVEAVTFLKKFYATRSSRRGSSAITG